MNVEIADKIIELMYEKWFKDFVVGYSKPELIRETGYEENQINQVVDYLESKGLIYNNNPRQYVITAHGIDTRELIFPHATLAIKKQERTKILEILAELYQVLMKQCKVTSYRKNFTCLIGLIYWEQSCIWNRKGLLNWICIKDFFLFELLQMDWNQCKSLWRITLL